MSSNSQSEPSTEPRVVFTGRNTLRYKDAKFTLDDFRRVAKGLVNDAEKLLWNELMFCKDNSCIDAIDVRQLKYGMDDPSKDHCFPRRDGNPINVAGGPNAILDRASTMPSTRDEITFSPDTHDPIFSRTFQINYQVALHRFLCCLFCVIHVIGGLPMTDKQVLSIRYIDNGRRPRNLYIDSESGAIMIIPEKRNVNSGPAPRFLPPQVSKMVIAYLTTVVPFIETMDLGPPTMVPEKGWVFDYFGSGAWLTLPMEFSSEFKKRLEISVDANDYRRIVLAIAEKQGMRDFVRLANAE
jgi:hypothetical protein